jgi:hypothetical protein
LNHVVLFPYPHSTCRQPGFRPPRGHGDETQKRQPPQPTSAYNGCQS